MNTTDFKSFHFLENGDIEFSIYDTIKSTRSLDAGFYNVEVINVNGNLEVALSTKENKETLKIHQFPDYQKINSLIGSFFSNNVKDKITTLGFFHKVGILFYGKEGTGKSTIIKYYCERLVKEQEALVFYFNNKHRIYTPWKFIKNIRKTQSNPIVIVFEEFDELINNGLEPELKELMDGHESINDCLFFATTNYIDKIPAAIKDRPSRFKYSLNIEGLQLESDIKELLNNMIADICTEEEIDILSSDLKGKTLDEIKQFCIDKIMDISHYEIKKKTIGYKNKIKNHAELI